MNIGRLNKRITIENATVTRDINGGEIIQWVTYCRAWATPKYIFGREHEEQDRETSMMQVDFTIRENKEYNIDEKMRVLYDGEYFNIQNVFRYANNEMIVLKTQKRL